MYTRLWCQEYYRGSGERSKEGLARAGRWVRVPVLGNWAVSNGSTSRLKDAGIAAEALGGAADEQYSRAENVVGVEKAPDLASGGGDAA